MSEMEYIKQLEERVEKLEKIISRITIDEGENVSINNCPLSDIYVSEGCNLTFTGCPIGAVISGNIDDAEDRIDDISSDIDDAEGRIDDLEDRLNDIVGQIDDIEKSME